MNAIDRAYHRKEIYSISTVIYVGMFDIYSMFYFRYKYS